MNAFLARPIEGDWACVWLDATYVKVQRDHHIVSVAVIVAVGVNTDGRREVPGMTVGHSEAEPFWTEFLRSLARRGLRGTRLVIPDAHEGLKAAITKELRLRQPDALPLSPGLRKLRAMVASSMQQVRVEDMLRQVDRWTGLSRALVPLGGYEPRSGEDLYRTLLAALIAHGTNLGVAAMAGSIETAIADGQLRPLRNPNSE